MKILEIWFHRTRLVTWLVFISLFSPLSGSHAQNLPPALMVEENNPVTPLAISKADGDVRILAPPRRLFVVTLKTCHQSL